MVIAYEDLIKITTAYTPKEYRNLGSNHFPVYEELQEQVNPLIRRSKKDERTNVFDAYLISTLESAGSTSEYVQRLSKKGKKHEYVRADLLPFDMYRAKLFVMCENLVAAGRGHLEVYYCDKRQVWDNPKVKFNIPEMELVKQKTGD